MNRSGKPSPSKSAVRTCSESWPFGLNTFRFQTNLPCPSFRYRRLASISRANTASRSPSRSTSNRATPRAWVSASCGRWVRVTSVKWSVSYFWPSTQAEKPHKNNRNKKTCRCRMPFLGSIFLGFMGRGFKGRPKLSLPGDRGQGHSAKCPPLLVLGYGPFCDGNPDLLLGVRIHRAVFFPQDLEMGPVPQGVWGLGYPSSENKLKYGSIGMGALMLKDRIQSPWQVEGFHARRYPGRGIDLDRGPAFKFPAGIEIQKISRRVYRQGDPVPVQGIGNGSLADAKASP